MALSSEMNNETAYLICGGHGDFPKSLAPPLLRDFLLVHRLDRAIPVHAETSIVPERTLLVQIDLTTNKNATVR